MTVVAGGLRIFTAGQTVISGGIQVADTGMKIETKSATQDALTVNANNIVFQNSMLNVYTSAWGLEAQLCDCWGELWFRPMSTKCDACGCHRDLFTTPCR